MTYDEYKKDFVFHKWSLIHQPVKVSISQHFGVCGMVYGVGVSVQVFGFWVRVAEFWCLTHEAQAIVDFLKKEWKGVLN